LIPGFPIDVGGKGNGQVEFVVDVVGVVVLVVDVEVLSVDDETCEADDVGLVLFVEGTVLLSSLSVFSVVSVSLNRPDLKMKINTKKINLNFKPLYR
jgi:hypothetical protein